MLATVLVAVLFSAAAASTTSCGGFGEPICTDPFCLLDATQEIVDGRCVKCGFEGQPPCKTKPACTIRNFFPAVVLGGVCRACGYKDGQPPCVDPSGARVCYNPTLHIVDGYCTLCGGLDQPVCLSGVPGGCKDDFVPVAALGGMCRPCGFVDRAPACNGPDPCPFGPGSANVYVSTNGICRTCGFLGDVVCPGNRCTEGKPLNGKCDGLICGFGGHPRCPNKTTCNEGSALLNGLCVECGGPDQPPCVAGKCKRYFTDYAGGVTFDAAKGVCRFCGFFSEKPCAGSKPCAGVDQYTTSIVIDGQCQECGHSNEVPCADGSCYAAKVPVINGRCRDCGNPGQWACKGAAPCSFSPSKVDTDGKCRNCGGQLQLACAQGVCTGLNQQQQPSVVIAGICHKCGYDGPACKGPCKSFYGYDQGGICVRCGLNNRKICPDGSCYKPTMTKANGLCHSS